MKKYVATYDYQNWLSYYDYLLQNQMDIESKVKVFYKG